MCAAIVLVSACEENGLARATASPLAPTSSAAATPNPSTLPTPDQETTITRALANAGIRVELMGQSKFEWVLRSAAPRSGVFSGHVDGRQARAEVLFLEGPVDGLRACSRPDVTGLMTFTVSLRGRPQVLANGTATGYTSSTAPVYFAISDRLFVITSDERLRDALRSSLGLTVPDCLWREPETLPVFPQERSVIGALEAAQIQLTLIGASKFEGLLGSPRPARVFIEQTGAGGAGADVLFLERPIAGVRVCRSTTSAGLNRYDVFIGDRLVSSGEGTQAVLISMNDRYFIHAIGDRFHEALMRGLGTREPPC
jgi:hypothetical protein